MIENSFKVCLSSGSSQVTTGSGILKNLQPCRDKKIVLFADESLCESIDATGTQLRKENEVFTLKVKAGEGLKSFSSLEKYYEQFAEFGLNRHSYLVALGGGTIGDVGGFLAATYMRGIKWIGLPTTLLAQVDSSLGGKTGVNLSSGKNLVGAFCQPEGIICDIDFLKTLPQRDIVSGLGEILKYGLVFDPDFFHWICNNWTALCAKETDSLSKAVHRSLKWKAQTVEKDEFDLKGIRENLNFGHTMGHAFEALGEYSKLRHGEAVFAGMVFAVHLSVVRGHLSSDIAVELLAKMNSLTTGIAKLDIGYEETLPFLKKDKKNFGDKFTFILLKNLAETVRDDEVTQRDIEQVFKEFTWPK